MFRRGEDEARELDAEPGAAFAAAMRPSVLIPLAAALAVAAQPACRPRPTAPAPPPAPAATAGPLPGTDPRPLTPARREVLEEFGQAMAARLTAGEFDAIARDLDLTAMTDAAFAGINWEENPKWVEFRDSLVRRLRADPGQLFSALGGAQATFLRLHETPSGTAALVRCLLPTGAATYFDIFARFEEATGTAHLGNIYNHATGLDVPDSLRAILLALAPSADRSLADRLFGVEKAADPAVMTAFDTALRQRDPAAVAAWWPKLPASMRAQRPVFMAALQVLMLDPKAPAYLAALEEARVVYANEPLADLLAIDVHFLRNDAEALEACLDRIEARLGGPDAHLTTLRASGRLAAGNAAGAEQAVAEALRLEPDFANALLTRLKLLISRRDFTGAVNLLQTMEDTFGRVFEPPAASRGPAYTDFLDSPEYKKWLALHPAAPPDPAPIPAPAEEPPPAAGQTPEN
jgi:hypothetical protein